MSVLSVLGLAVVLLLAGTTSARASVTDVIRDYNSNNATITRCHDREDLIEARRVGPEQTYGDLPGAIDVALNHPELVGTPERPCPPVDESGEEDVAGGWGGRDLTIVIGLQIVILGAVVWLRRRWITRVLGAAPGRLRRIPGRVWVIGGTAVVVLAVLVGALSLRSPPAPTVTVLDRTVHSPTVAMQDDRLLHQPPRSAAFIRSRMRQMAALGADTVRVDLRWDLVAPSPPTVAATDPSDPAYDWTTYDRIVAEAARADLTVFFSVWGTPDWAVDPAVAALPTDPDWGNRRPGDPADFGAFATAAVARYAPRGVQTWEVWNEPNMNMFLRPQYEKRGDEWVAVGPETYAELLEAFARSARSVDPDVRIVLGGLAPVGDRCDTRCTVEDDVTPSRLGPQQFLRAFAALPQHEVVDVVAIHPYPSARPPRPGDPVRTRKLDVDNLADLRTVLRSTSLAGRPVWLTEYGWQTEGTTALPYAVTPDEQAASVADSLALFSRFPEIGLASYYLLQDNGAFNSGLFTDVAGDALDAPKPSAQAFALPLTQVGDTENGRVTLTGQVRPSRGTATAVLERRVDGHWREFSTITTRDDGTFAIVVDPHGHDATIRLRWTDADGVDRTGRPVQLAG